VDLEARLRELGLELPEAPGGVCSGKANRGPAHLSSHMFEWTSDSMFGTATSLERERSVWLDRRWPLGDATLFQELLERLQVRPRGWVTISWRIHLGGLTCGREEDKMFCQK